MQASAILEDWGWEDILTYNVPSLTPLTWRRSDVTSGRYDVTGRWRDCTCVLGVSFGKRGRAQVTSVQHFSWKNKKRLKRKKERRHQIQSLIKVWLHWAKIRTRARKIQWSFPPLNIRKLSLPNSFSLSVNTPLTYMYMCEDTCAGTRHNEPRVKTKTVWPWWGGRESDKTSRKIGPSWGRRKADLCWSPWGE